MKTALVTGIRGQDGAYLADLLIKKGYRVVGADRRSGDTTLWRLKELGIFDQVEIAFMDLLELTNIYRVIEKIQPDEVYNLAAQSFVGVSFEQPILTSDINGLGTLRLIEAIRLLKPDCRFYQASTSEMFGKVQETPQKESTPFYPRSPYGVSKLLAHWMCINYRESFDMFACNGILFNHESPFRGLDFVTRKITYGIARIQNGLQDKVVLGNIDASRDWGYAKEYVEGMWLMLQQDQPDDYILATGETHTVREFIKYALQMVGREILWEGEAECERGIDSKTGQTLIEISPDYYRPAEVDCLIGDASKARKHLNWQPRTDFKQLVEIMMEADLHRVAREIQLD